MQKQRLTISLDASVAARVRECAGRHGSGGASGYLERLVRQDATREAADAMARWYAQRPELLSQEDAERVAAAGELGETA